MPPQLSAEDLEVITELRRGFHAEIDNVVQPLRQQMNALAQRTSRAPGVGLEHTSLDLPMSLSHQLTGDASFQSWVKNVKTSREYFATELRLPTNRKAGTPVSGIAPTQYLPQRIWGPAQFPLRLRDIMPTMPVASGSVEYTVETSFTPSAGVVPETQSKPPMAISFAEATAKCATVASVIKVSKQSLMDVGLMNTWLSVRLGYSVNLKEEDMLINGDATNSISGLMQLAPAFVYTPATGDTGMDVIAHAIGNLTGKGYVVDGVILNADDYTAMRLLKTTIGSYIFMGEGGKGADDESIWEGTPLVWQVPMVVSPSMAPGSFLVGAFQQSTILFARETLTVEIAFQNEDDFVRNLVTMRAELRSGLAVPVPAGVLKGTLPAGSLTATQAAPATASNTTKK